MVVYTIVISALNKDNTRPARVKPYTVRLQLVTVQSQVQCWTASCDIHRAPSGSLQHAHLWIFSTFHHRSTPPITVQYRWTATNLSHPQLAPSSLTGNSLTLHAAWRHSSADSLDCSNCYQSKCDGHCEFWGSRRTDVFFLQLARWNGVVSAACVQCVWAPRVIAWIHPNSNYCLLLQNNVQQAVPLGAFIISYGTVGFGCSEYWAWRYDTV